jgi:hypothetical protein
LIEQRRNVWIAEFLGTPTSSRRVTAERCGGVDLLAD